MKALSIRQPWAWAIVTGKKPVENRFVLTDARSLPFVPCKGALGFFDVPPDVAARLRALAAKEG
jgi:hypothetical protein